MALTKHITKILDTIVFLRHKPHITTWSEVRDRIIETIDTVEDIKRMRNSRSSKGG